MNKKTALKLIRNKKGEIWKQLYEYKNYVISNYGRIKSIERVMSIGIRNGRECFRLKPQHLITSRTNKIEKFYFADIYFLSSKGEKRQKSVYIHRAVADHFVEKPNYIIQYEKDGGHISATHIIKDYENNRFDNVKWQTNIELIKNQPKRKADPTKAWKTRKIIYGQSGSNPNAKTGKVKKEKRKVEPQVA